MFFSSTTLKAIALAATTHAFLASAAPACQPQEPQPKAVYFMTNTPQNNIVALPVQQDGTLAQGTMTPTGGQGSLEVNPMTGQPAIPDGLSSQDAVKVSGKYLFAVNSGSDTLSMFKIDKQDPTKLTLVGQPASVNGDFPVTVAISDKNSLACVASTGAKAGVSCGSFSDAGLAQMDQLRSLSFDLEQTTPPSGPTNTVGDIIFSQDQQTLYTIVKGNMTTNQPGGVAAYPVVNGQPATTPVSNNQLNGTAVLFGTTRIPGTDSLFASDASIGGAILSASKDGTSLSVQKTINIPGQKASCWAIISKVTGTAFLTDAGTNALTEVDPKTGDIIASHNLSAPNTGNFDLRARGNFLYTLAHNGNMTTAIQVLDISAGRGQAKQIQNFTPMNVSATTQGMAIFS